MHYLLAICLILPLTQAWPGSVLPTQQEEMATITPDPVPAQEHPANDDEEEGNEPDCD